MKKIYYSILTLSITLLIVYACQNPLENIIIPVSPKLSTYEVAIKVSDVSNPASLSEEGALEVELLGPDADKILNNAGESTFSAKNGIINLAVNKKYSDIVDPLRFTVKVSGENYLTTTIPVVIDGTSELMQLYANVVNIETPPVGVKVEKEVATIVGDGSVTEEIVVSTSSDENAEDVEGPSTEISIHTGTVFKNAEGEVLHGNELEVQVINFDSNEPSSLESFPGGFSPNSVIDQSGEEVTTGNFVTAGFASIDMFVDGEEVTEFSEPIEVVMKINDDTYNPETNEPIKVGDIVPIWSYSNDDGQWVFHGDGVVTPAVDGSLEVKYTTTHLSSYNLDFFTNNRRCSSGSVVVEIEDSHRLPSGNSYELKAYLVSPNSSQPLGNGRAIINITKDTKEITLNNSIDMDMQLLIVRDRVVTYSGRDDWHSPALPDADSVVFYEYINHWSHTYKWTEHIYRSEVFNGCDNNISISLYDHLSKLDASVEVYVEYAGYCDNKKIAPSVNLYRKKADGEFGFVGYVDKGIITMSVPKLDSTYLFGFYWGDTFYEDSLHIDSERMVNTNLNLDEFCDKILENL
ncbi:hypothetical protein [Flammeovirga sp. EKP202]|uniref:hypothetical protein n=1 Tax=Flammeovirga sp. EKP202 TaxID=2770592 RepID=UPI00165FB441|nr:hypothetical protein [Flammeovirga sp. EKP202]MBD0403435.1 hypothetical protein [Flammeovirga sp. EKP202]